MNNFSKTFTIATIFVGCSIYASDEKGSIVQKYVDASGKVTLVERSNQNGATVTRTAIREENGTFKANETTGYPWCGPSKKILENSEDIFNQLEAEERRSQGNQPGYAIKGAE